MSLARTITAFCLDVSPSMGAGRLIEEEVMVQPDGSQGPGQEGVIGSADSNGGLAHATVAQTQQSQMEAEEVGIQKRQRRITDLAWAMEFVAKKVQNVILSNLKTAKVYLQVFGSTTTDCLLVRADSTLDGYKGINEIFLPEQPTLSTLEMVRRLRATPNELADEVGPSDPLTALTVAMYALRDKTASGSTSNWTRVIYIVTDASAPMDTEDANQIKDVLRNENMSVRVIGIDFDDEEAGFVQEDKPAQKAKNELWWRTFVSDLPGSSVATASRVIEQASLPTIQLQGSAPYSTSLTFGDPEQRRESNEVLDIAIKVYKATAQARPLSQKKLSKIAQDTVAARRQAATHDGTAEPARYSGTYSSPKRPREVQDDGVTYGVQLQKKYFIKDDLDNVEGGINSVEPLPEGAEDKFDRAYKLGATLVAINDDLTRKQDTKAGLEIIQFNNKSNYRRHLHLGETWFVFASDDNRRAELQLSSLIHALWQLEKYALVRFVRRDGAEAKLGILAPQIRDEAAGIDYECLFLVEVPFREDIKRFTFPPLDRVINREGQELYEHATLPSEEMQTAMDEVVDSMDLMDADQDDEGQPMPWFSCEQSFNPAIHTIKEAVSWRVFHPEDRALPRPHRDVLRYLKPPTTVLERSTPLLEKCRDLFDLQFVPSAAARRLASRKTRQGDDPDAPAKEIDLGGVMDDELAAEATRNPPPDSQTLTAGEGSATLPPPSSSEPASTVAPVDETSQSPAKAGTSNGNTIEFDREDPLADFRKKLGITAYKIEDVMDAMAQLIRSTIQGSFGSNDYPLARDLLLGLRAEACEYEEAPRFNEHLRALKQELLNSSTKGRSRTDFWDNFVRGREDLSLIRDDEAIGDTTGINASQSAEFINL